MATKEVPKGEYESSGIGRDYNWDIEFGVYRDCFKKLEEDIVSTRNCLDYIISIVMSDCDYISSLLLIYNQKLKLIKETCNKIDLFNERKNILFDNYLNLIKKYENVKNISKSE